jgi:hypothetical protein
MKVNNFTGALFISAICTSFSQLSIADITLKTGQVIGSDGKVYDGMSPQMEEYIRSHLEEGETKVGVVNGSVYIINSDTTTTVPLVELRSLDKDERLEHIKEAVREEYRERLSSEIISNDMDSEVNGSIDSNEYEIEDSLTEHEGEIEDSLREHESEIEDSLREHESEIEDSLREHESEIEDSLREHESEIHDELESGSDDREDDHDDDD